MSRILLLGLWLLFMVPEGTGQRGDARSVSGQTNTGTADDTHGNNHLTDHIMSQISKGHVTTEMLIHWSHEISTALHQGTMTMDEYHELVALIHAEEVKHPEACCIFG